MKIKSLFVIVTLSNFVLSFQAFSSEQDPCVSHKNTIENRACASLQLAETEKLLNATYHHTLDGIRSTVNENGESRSPRQLLIESQRKWIEFRKLDCEAQVSVYFGGTVAPEIFMGCMRERAQQRIKELDITNWQGG